MIGQELDSLADLVRLVSPFRAKDAERALIVDRTCADIVRRRACGLGVCCRPAHLPGHCRVDLFHLLWTRSSRPLQRDRRKRSQGCHREGALLRGSPDPLLAGSRQSPGMVDKTRMDRRQGRHPMGQGRLVGRARRCWRYSLGELRVWTMGRGNGEQDVARAQTMIRAEAGRGSPGRDGRIFLD